MFEWAFLVKKIVAAFCMPLPMLVLLLCLAGILYWRKKFLIAKSIGVFSIVFFYLISIQVTSNFFASKLEYQYPSYQKQKNERVDFVLVLGSWHSSDSNQPISTLLSSSGLKRLVEGIRVYRLNSGSKLLLSGYALNDEISHAQALKKVAIHLGVPESDMILAGDVKDTNEEAYHWANLAKGKSLVVVTSASHMPRSMYLFQQVEKSKGLKLHLIAAPTDYVSHKELVLFWRSWFPSGANISYFERVWHEYLGIFWAYLAG
ncbi:MAG: uncharacterized SAM-binding protein YcdF (DUF218 family) [Oleiphilaceae bacterium]|jgi:uncharacterized SAM-binding protein YcdF (DUF218 family)